MSHPRPTSVVREAAAIWIRNWFQWSGRCMLWVLCWLTVVLGPPATFALFYAAHYSVHGAELSLRELAAAARGFFFQSWLWMLANLTAGVVIWAGFAAPGQALRWAALAFGLLWLAVQFYALPYFMLQERKNIPRALRGGSQAVFAAPLFTLVTFGLALAVGLISLMLVAPLVLGGPGLVAVLAAQAAFEHRDPYRGLEE